MQNKNLRCSSRRTVHLEWFINSKCDYTCKGCRPSAAETKFPDLGLDACRMALKSFMNFARVHAFDIKISVYPRQAKFATPFLEILHSLGELRRNSEIKFLTMVIRGDLPQDKIDLFQRHAVDSCLLTVDGPPHIQDALRRRNSFRDTWCAMRAIRAAGMHVEPQAIPICASAPFLADLVGLLAAEQFDDFRLKVNIASDVSAARGKTGGHPHPRSPWNRQLTPRAYRLALLKIVQHLDLLGPEHVLLFARTISKAPMMARLFHELGRLDQYRQAVRRMPAEDFLLFQLQANGSVYPQAGLPMLGQVPSTGFLEMYESAHPLRWFSQRTAMQRYRRKKQAEFYKCRTCPAAEFCMPLLVGAHGGRLFYAPDPRCWVS